MTDDLFSSSSLQVLKAVTLEKIANRLDQTKHLMTDDDNSILRDWRGLMEIANLDHDEQNKVKSNNNNYTNKIIMIWCKKPGVTVQSMMDAFRRMDRLDIQQDFRDLILADCAYAHGQGINLMGEISSDRLDQALTLHDLNALVNGQQLPVYDAMVLFGDTDIDHEFGCHVVERLEAGGRKIFVKERDLVVGTMEHDASMDIIRARCKKVIPILTPTFETSKGNLYLTKYAQEIQVRDGKSLVVPVIYSPHHLEFDLVKNLMCTKLPYQPKKKFNNFWEKLFGVLGATNLPQHLKTYDFPEPSIPPPPQAPPSMHLPPPLTPTQAAPVTSPVSTVSSFTPLDNNRDYLTPRIPPPTGHNTYHNPVIQRFDSLSSIDSAQTGVFSLPDEFGETDDSQANLIYPEAPTHEPGGTSNSRTRTSLMGKIKSKLKM